MESNRIMALVILVVMVLLYFYIMYKSCKSLNFGISWIIHVLFVLASDVLVSYLISGNIIDNIKDIILVIKYCIISLIQVAVYFKISKSTNSFISFFLLSVLVYFVIGILFYLVGIVINYFGSLLY